ncbi:OmpA family protein [Actibacterium pelagium]|uniref:Membrane protein n=1 Tax=Actibacterium pelagium TaxID=2029103 RepID=A0A917AKZ9_9RHOB|nr:OmpA family protein [Actibacterium pelagium]GGE58592.1 membrane protein [Actibacterium pelagium]
MRLNLTQATALTFALAIGLAVIGAIFAANAVERRTAFEIQRVLGLEGYDWAQVTPDGLRVHLAGVAPTESARFRALTLAGQIIDSDRVIDEMGVTPTKDIRAPEFSIEILRKPNGLSAIGLIPASQDRAKLLTDLDDAAEGADLTDLLETADYPLPDGWTDAVEYGVSVVAGLPRAKVSISPGLVFVESITDNERARRELSSRLRDDAPEGVSVVTQIVAPRPAITPFVLRAVREGEALRFDACSASTAGERSQILLAAREAGAEGGLNCVLGLGAPSDKWGEAAALAIETLGKIGDGSVTFTNADISLVAASDVDPALFEAETNALARALPSPYTLLATIRPAKVSKTDVANKDVPEFQVILSPEGHVRLSGPLPDDLSQQAVESYVYSRFGSEHISNRIEQSETLPDGWPLRVLTGIEALSLLNHGIVTIQPSYLELSGTTGYEEARSQVTQLFGRNLESSAVYSIDVEYLETLDPEAGKPTPQECVDRVNDILKANKITFAPSSVTIEGASVGVINKIAEAMQDCQDVPMEIAGHTDSQGREEMNLQLSQSRAEAVLNALLARRILTTNLRAKGYGETNPIADNGTEEGREANRRIEFTLLGPKPEPEAETTPETEDTAENAETEATPAPETETAETTASEEEPAPEADSSPSDVPSDEDTASDQIKPTGPGADAKLVARPSTAPASE